MMGCTDRHCRYFHRLLAPRARLYTEMIPAAALVHRDGTARLAHHPAEHPLAIQLGGSDPDLLAAAAERAAGAGFDEINLNCGCPSPRVQRGAFGAVLMLEPGRVAAMVRAMARASGLAVTVKCRIGVDEHDDFAVLARFAEAVAGAGCRTLIVHARKAWLEGLSPKANRTVPPLDHERVYRLKETFPELRVVTNGGIASVEEATRHLGHVDGVMIGRAAYERPWLLVELSQSLWRGACAPTLKQVAEAMAVYAQEMQRHGVPLQAIYRHLLGLGRGQPGARAFRRLLSARMRDPGAPPGLLLEAVALLQSAHQAEAA